MLVSGTKKTFRQLEGFQVPAAKTGLSFPAGLESTLSLLTGC
jgi:hypothetical protein